MNVNEYERRPGDYIDDFKDIRNHILGIVLKEFIGRTDGYKSYNEETED